MKKILIIILIICLFSSSFAFADVFIAPVDGENHVILEGRAKLLDVTSFVTGLANVCGAPLSALSKVPDFVNGFLKTSAKATKNYYNSMISYISDYNNRVIQSTPTSGGSAHHSFDVTYSPDDRYYMTQYLKSLFPDGKIEGGGNSAAYEYNGLEVESYGVNPSTWAPHPVTVCYLDIPYEDIAWTTQDLDYSGFTIDFPPELFQGDLSGLNLSCRGLSVRDSAHNSTFAIAHYSIRFAHRTWEDWYDDMLAVRDPYDNWKSGYGGFNTAYRYHGNKGPIVTFKYPYRYVSGNYPPTQANCAELDYSAGWDSVIYLALPYGDSQYQLLCCPFNNSNNQVLMANIFSNNIVLNASDLNIIPPEPTYSFTINENNYYTDNNDNSVTYNISNLLATPTEATLTDYSQYLIDINDTLEDIEDTIDSLPLGTAVINPGVDDYFSDDEQSAGFLNLFNLIRVFFVEQIPEYQGLIRHYLPEDLGAVGATLLGLATVLFMFRLL